MYQSCSWSARCLVTVACACCSLELHVPSHSLLCLCQDSHTATSICTTHDLTSSAHLEHFVPHKHFVNKLNSTDTYTFMLSFIKFKVLQLNRTDKTSQLIDQEISCQLIVLVIVNAMTSNICSFLIGRICCCSLTLMIINEVIVVWTVD